MAYQPQIVDVPFYGPNQALPDRSGPSGRIKLLKNAKVRKYVAASTSTAGTTPATIQIDPRDGLVPLATGARSVTNGATVTVDWATPSLLAPIGPQLVDVSGGVLRVWNGSTWTAYDQSLVVTHPLSQSVLHTSQKLIQAPDSAWLAGVTCAVWTETTATAAGPLTTSYVGFKADNGAWLVAPTPLYAASSPTVIASARVVADGTYFWVFHSTSVNGLVVTVYDVHGALQNAVFTNIAQPLHSFTSGTWDVVAAASPGGYTVLAAISIDGTNDGGVTLTALKISAGTVSQNAATLNTIHASSNVAFLTNDTGNGKTYLATTYEFGSAVCEPFVYEISAQAITHTFGPIVVLNLDANKIDSFAGYAFTGSDGIDVLLSLGLLQAYPSPSTTGPAFDPARRTITTYTCDRSNVIVKLRTTQSLCQVSRAFSIDGVYHVVGYYQSGSGTVITPRSHSVTATLGDTMTGAAAQSLAVTAGDRAVGSAVSVSSSSAVAGPTVTVTDSSSALSVASGDTVVGVSSTGRAGLGIPDGTLILRWHFANLSPTTGSTGSRLTLAGTSGVAGANTTWDVITVDTTNGYFYTLTNDITGAFPIVAGGTFAAAGTVQRISMVGYEVADLSPYISSRTAAPFVGGSVVISGAGISGNNGTFTIARVYYGNGPDYGYAVGGVPGGGVGVVWVAKTAQSTETHAFSAVLTPVGVNQWTFAAGAFDSTYVGAQLTISDDAAQPANNQTYTIASVQSATTLTTSGGTVISQVFDAGGATATIQLVAQSPYTFRIGALPADYTYMGAVVSVQGAAAVNNGTYIVTQVNIDGSFVALPTNGMSNQVNEALGPSQTITIYFPDNQPTVQPTWYLVPLTGTQPVTGRFEYGSACADWRVEGDLTYAATGTLFPSALSTPVVTSTGTRFLLPYRAENVVVAEPLVSVAGFAPITDEVIESTVGLKVFTLGTGAGQPIVGATTMLLPGPMAQAFSQSGLLEAGIGLAPEAPFLVSQSVGATGVLGLTKGATYIYQPVFEMADENGDIVDSIPCLSPLTVVMSGSNNVATIGGRLAFPLGTAGAPVANTYGPFTRNVTISIYRTAWVNGVSTTQKYKITNGLSPNEIAPVSATNPSGFSFPDSFTWQYVDATPDAGLTASQGIYSDTEFPHYPPPAFSRGFGNYKNRDWALAYDGSLWVSAEKKPGQATWWHPSFRWTFPQSDPPKTVGYLEESVFVLCGRTIYQIPLGGAELPTATGGGSLPTPVSMPWPNGSANGYALSIPGMIVYDSTAGGAWAITRALENVWLSHAMVDSLAGAISGLAVDGDQKLYIQQQGSSDVLVYDHLPGVWGIVTTPTSPKLIASFQGAFVYQDAAAVYVSTPGATADVVGGVLTGIAPDVTFASISFASVRGQKMVWGLQLIGTYLGPHRINFVISYADDGYPDQAIAPFTPDDTKPYIIPFYLANEEVTSFGLRVFADFNLIATPGASFALEMLSAEIGVERSGLAKLPDARTAK